MASKSKPFGLYIFLCVTVLLLCIQMAFSGWTIDGGYEGAYPGGCTKLRGECPDFEHCICDEKECTPGNNLCRCMYGCVMEGLYLRYEQYRAIPNKGICLCTNPLKNEIKCVPHLDEF